MSTTRRGSIMEKVTYAFTVTASNDGEPAHYAKIFTSALEAVTVFNSFVDHGFANMTRTVNLYEPTGKCHTRVFKRGAGLVSSK
jgi:hypothetical protein